MSKATNKAVIYYKLSSNTEASVAFQRQADVLKELATADGYTDITVLETTARRPQYDQLIKAIETGVYGAVYVYDLTRIARDASKVREFLDTADKTGTELRIATLPGLSEATEPARSIMLDMLLMLTERDVLDGSKRTRQGIAAKRGAYRVEKASV
jgi:DNA invertase Pin-like site-specific DNA recombinase